MDKGKYKEKHMSIPIENQETAALANKKDNKDISNVNLPDEMQVWNGKKYVDTNQK